MWALNNDTPYSAERNWVRDKAGAHHWLVAVKATFQIAPDGRLTLADEQLAPVLAPEYRGAPGTTSLRYDSDLLALKPSTDVLVEAEAHAPHGRAAPSVPVALRFEGVDKTLVVRGTRVYTNGIAGLTTSNPVAFTSRPIVYEWAFGGYDASDPDVRKHRLDARNPVGKGVAGSSTRLVGQPAHAVEYPSGNPAKVGPAGFGPIDASWSPRRELAGTYDARWEQTTKPLLPADYDESFAMSSPADQRPARPLRGGERMELVNMTREGVLRFGLPKIYLVFTTYFGARAQEHRAQLATVFVDATQLRLEMVWQTALRVLPRDVDHLDETRISEKPFLT